MSEFIQPNSKYEILTPNGWSDFTGVKKTIKIGAYRIKAQKQDGSTVELVCSKYHRLKTYKMGFLNAFDVQVGFGLDDGQGGYLKVIEVEQLEEKAYEFFDLLDVEKEKEYFTNDFISHNCAHIPESVVTELWLSVYPTLSTGGSAILISTPNGTENLFYRIWSDAKEGINEFVTMELPWTVHPERDEEWYKKDSAITRAARGERGVLQEYHCVFVGSGDTFIDADVMANIEKDCIPAPFSHPAHRGIRIWKQPIEGRRYLITSDVASGTATDFTTMCIIDLETGEAVGEFKEKITPQEFTPILKELGEYYNTAIVCPELNSYGLIVSETLRKEKYPKLYFERMNSILEVETYEAEQFEMPGWKTTEGTRPDMLAKLDYMLSTGKLKIYSKELLAELKHFVWKNNKPQAAKKKNDDLVIAYSIGAKLLSTIDEDLKKEEEKELISTDVLNAMLGGLTQKESKIDLSQKQVLFVDEQEKKKPDQNQASQPWNWIF